MRPSDLIEVIATTLFTLLVPVVQTAGQLLILRASTSLGARDVRSAVFPIAIECSMQLA